MQHASGLCWTRDLQFYRSIPIIAVGGGLRYTIHNQIDVQLDGAFIECVSYTGGKCELKLEPRILQSIFLACRWLSSADGGGTIKNNCCLLRLCVLNGNSCFPFGQKNRSLLLLSLKPHVPFARNGGHHAHWFYRSLSPQGPPFVQGRVAQTCILT
jgi:hypothetical protein